MKVKYKTKIGSYTVIANIGNATVDSEETKKHVAARIKPKMSEADIEELYNSHLQYAKTGPEGDLISDDMGVQIQQLLDGRGEHRQLLDTGEYIDDYRDMEYWKQNKSGRWVQEKIAAIGEAVPGNAVVLDRLDQERRREIEQAIAAQKETDRLASLTPEQKAEEKRAKLHALAREALQKAEEAELLDEDFDKQAWIQPKKAEIEALYA
jgi:hypothetical protein